MAKDILTAIDEALRNRGAAPKPDWKQVIKFRLSKDETEALATWRAERKTIDAKLALVSPPAIARLRKGRAKAIATHATDPKSDPFGGQVDRVGLERAAKVSRSRLKEATARIDHEVAVLLVPAGNRLYSEAEQAIEAVVRRHESDCLRFSLPPDTPSSLAGVLRRSLEPLARALGRGRVSPSALEAYVGPLP